MHPASHSLKNTMGPIGAKRGQATMICPERERLLQAYHAAVSAYADVVSQLKNADKHEFPKQFALADAARENCDRLREKIETHRNQHRC